MKKYLILFLAFLPIFLTGCGNNNFDNSYYPTPDDDVIYDSPNYLTEDYIDAIVSIVESPEIPHLTTWQESYAALLMDYALLFPHARFFLFDIDGNGIPELIISFSYVYTYTDKGVIAVNNDYNVFEKCANDGLGTTRSISGLLQTQDNMLVVRHYFAADVTFRRINILDNRLIIDATGSLYIETYYLNDTPISSEEFAQIFEGTCIFFDVRNNSITEENILLHIFLSAYANHPHPFATALREYMADYDGVVRAFLATLDDGGTMGVLVTRPTTAISGYCHFTDEISYVYGHLGTLFYMQDGELFKIDAGGLFVSGRYNRLVWNFHAHTHDVEIIYKLESGRLETSTRLEYFSDEYLLYLFDNDYNIVAELIAERDAHAKYAREKYGLVALLPPNFGHMRNTECQTAQILAMTASCVPHLATVATVTGTQTGQISVIIGDIPVNFAVGQPIQANGCILVPVHEFFNLLGFGVTEYPQTQQIRLFGSTKTITVDVPVQVIDGVTMIPIHAILESAGYSVQWDADTQTVIITRKP